MPLFQLPVENNKYLNFEWRGRGGVWILLFSEVTLFEYNVSTSLSPIKVLFHVSFFINIVTFEYLTRVFFSFFLSPNLSRCWAAEGRYFFFSFFLSLFVSFNEIYTTGSLHFPSGIVERAKRERA